MRQINNQRGQVALIVLLVSAVLLTLGLSMSRRTVLETRIDTDEELLKQAFNNAESGIDYYLNTSNTTYTPSGSGQAAAEVMATVIGNSQTIDYDEFTLSGNATYYWLVGHDANDQIDTSTRYNGSQLQVCVGNSYNGAIKVDYFYDQSGSYGVSRQGYNVNGGSVTNYTTADVGAADSCGSGRRVIDVSGLMTGNPLLVAVTPISTGSETGARISLRGNANFPIQGEEISSTGIAGDADDLGGVKRRVKVVNRYKLPTFMLEAVSSQTSVLSN